LAKADTEKPNLQLKLEAIYQTKSPDSHPGSENLVASDLIATQVEIATVARFLA
jgi:hypothetical protein